MTQEQMVEELNRLKAENEALKNAPVGGGQGGLRVSPKGAITLSGIGVFGVTLFRNQWERLFQYLGIPVPEKMQAFITANESKLAVKPVGHVSKFAEQLKARAAEKKAAAASR